MDEKTKEALAVLAVEGASIRPSPFGEQYRQALAHLQAMAEENERLRAEVREWLCESCYTVYPGPPQKGVMCIICPKCGGPTAPRSFAQIRELKVRAEKAEAEVGRLDGAYKWLSQTNTELVEMREKAEADRDKWKAWYEERKDVAEGTRQMFNDKVAELEKVKADFDEAVKALVLQQGDMEKFRPLIEAAEGVEWVDASGRLQTTDDQAILRAVLKCREKAIPERDK